MSNLSEDMLLNLLDLSRLFELLNLPLPDNRKGIIEKTFIGKISRKNGKHFHKNLGALLFAKTSINLKHFHEKRPASFFTKAKIA